MTKVALGVSSAAGHAQILSRTTSSVSLFGAHTQAHLRSPPGDLLGRLGLVDGTEDDFKYFAAAFNTFRSAKAEFKASNTKACKGHCVIRNGPRCWSKCAFDKKVFPEGRG